MIITIEWEHLERRRSKMEMPDDATPEQITAAAVAEASKGRAGKLDEMLADAVGHVSWQAPDGRFGGRAQ